MKRAIQFLLATALCVLAATARAQLTIEITGSGAHQIPIALLPFAGESVLPTSITDIVEADLLRCGQFRMEYSGGINPLPTEPSQVDYNLWKNRNADALVIGAAQRLPDGHFEVRFRLLDVIKQVQLAGVAYTLTGAQVRVTAHHIADVIYQKLTGQRGVFSTRIAYVVKQGNRFELRIADADGQDAQVALASHEPIISPAWSPDGKRLAYVSFEQKKPVLYVHDLTTGKRHVLANFKGSNSAPAWSPDGKQIAAVLSKSGGSQIYLLHPDGSDVRRVTNSQSIDTEPNFSPDGKYLYFTSDRGGSPQIYRMPVGGGDATRITFDGEYNVTPRVSPDGKTMAFVTRRDGRFQIAVMDLASGQVQVLTNSDQNESPSFAPNGAMILYATVIGGRGVLAAVSTDGRVKQRLSIRAADVREPAWGPFLGN